MDRFREGMGGKGRFITFEGVEGSGKSRQLGLLADYLQGGGVPFRRTLEPGGTAFGRELRSVLLRSEGPAREPVAELLLYLADRYQHLKEVIEPALEEGKLVISDRYHDATLAYQGYARGLGMEWADGLAAILGIRRPDLTLVFDLPVELGLKRALLRNQSESPALGRFEAEELRFHEKVREGYLQLAKQEPSRISIIDASGAPAEVFERVLACLRKKGIL